MTAPMEREHSGPTMSLSDRICTLLFAFLVALTANVP